MNLFASLTCLGETVRSLVPYVARLRLPLRTLSEILRSLVLVLTKHKPPSSPDSVYILSTKKGREFTFLHFMIRCLLLYLFCSGLLSAQPIQFQDPAFKRALLKQKIDLNGDSEIDSSEAMLGRVLKLNSKSIRSLKGLEFFKNLTSLDCSDNLLDTLILEFHSELKDLNCSGNRLKYVSFSSIHRLRKLYCSGNSLRALEFNLPNLRILDCSNNQLTRLDLGLFTDKLQFLNCRNNALNELNVASFTDLRELDCSGNVLMKLSVITNPFLQKLNCRRNRLQFLVIHGAPYLHKIDASHNLLQGISFTDASKNVINIKLRKNPSGLRICADAIDVLKGTKLQADTLCRQWMLEPPVKKEVCRLDQGDSTLYVLFKSEASRITDLADSAQFDQFVYFSQLGKLKVLQSDVLTHKTNNGWKSSGQQRFQVIFKARTTPISPMNTEWSVLAMTTIDKHENYNDNFFLFTESLYDTVLHQSASFAVVRQNGKSGVISYGGKIILPIKYDSIIVNGQNDFYFKQDSLWGISGKFYNLVQARYNWIDDQPLFFRNIRNSTYNNFYYYLFKTRGQYAWMDEDYREITNLLYDSIWVIHHTYFCARKNGRVILIDPGQGKELTQESFQNLFSFNGLYLKVLVNGKQGLIDQKGKIILDTLYDGIVDLGFGFIMLAKGEKYGLLTPYGGVTDIIYDEIGHLLGYSVMVRKGSKWIRLNGAGIEEK